MVSDSGEHFGSEVPHGWQGGPLGVFHGRPELSQDAGFDRLQCRVIGNVLALERLGETFDGVFGGPGLALLSSVGNGKDRGANGRSGGTSAVPETPGPFPVRHCSTAALAAS